jgi:hypothetical protein
LAYFLFLAHFFPSIFLSFSLSHTHTLSLSLSPLLSLSLSHSLSLPLSLSLSLWIESDVVTARAAVSILFAPLPPPRKLPPKTNEIGIHKIASGENGEKGEKERETMRGGINVCWWLTDDRYHFRSKDRVVFYSSRQLCIINLSTNVCVI